MNDKFMKKSLPLIVILLSVFILSVIASFLIPSADILGKIVIIVFLLMLLWVIIFCITVFIDFIHLLIKGANRIGVYRGKSIFREIDDCMRGGREDDKQYYLCLHYIDRIYKSPEVNEIVKENGIEEFYDRKEYLEKRNSSLAFFVKRIATLSAILLTSLVSLASTDVRYFLQSREIELLHFIPILIPIITIVFSITIVVSILLFYATKGQLNSYLHEVRKYELKKIEEKLEEIYRNITTHVDQEVTKARMDIMRTQRIVTSILSNKIWSTDASKIMELDPLDNFILSESKIVEGWIKENKHQIRVVFVLNLEKWEKWEKLNECENCRAREMTVSDFKNMLTKEYGTLFGYMFKHCKGKIRITLDDERKVTF